MAAYRDWLNEIVNKIHDYKDTFTKKGYKKYKLDFLIRITKRVANFSAQCGECQHFQGEITKLVHDLGGSVQSSKEARKIYNKTIKRIVGHLKKKHKLIQQGSYMGLGMAIGTAIGVTIGSGMGNVGAGIGIGAGIGTAIGSALESKAKKEGKII